MEHGFRRKDMIGAKEAQLPGALHLVHKLITHPGKEQGATGAP